MALATLSIDIVAKLAKMEQDMGKAARIAEKNAQKIEKAFSGVGNVIKGGIAGISIGLLFNKFVDETVQAQREQAQLAAVLKSTGEAAGFSADQLNLMAERLSNASVFSEGEINNAQTRLLSYTNIVGDKFPEAMQVVIDMADRMGMSLEQSAETIGRALDVPSQGLSSLTKQGFRFSEEQKKLVENLEKTGRVAEAQGIVLDALKSSYGGAAAATRDTFGGSIAALKNQLDDLMTGEDGSLDGAREAVESLTAALDSPDVKKAFANMTSGLAKLIEMTVGASAGFINLSSDVLDWAKKTIGGAFDKKELAGVASEVIRLKKELDLLNDLVVRDNTNVAVPHWKERIEEVSAQLEIAKQKFREADRAFQMAHGPDPAAFSKMDFVPSTLPAIRVVGAIGGEDKRYEKAIAQLKEQIALIGQKTELEKISAQIELGNFGKLSPARSDALKQLADTLDKTKALQAQKDVVAKLFEDNAITRAAKFQVAMEQLDEAFFSGKKSAAEYDAAMQEHTKATSTATGVTSDFLDKQKRLNDIIARSPTAQLEEMRKEMDAVYQAFTRGDFGTVIVDELGNVTYAADEAKAKFSELAKVVLKVPDEVKPALDAMGEFQKQAARNLQDAVGDTLSKTMKGEFDSISRLWGDLLIDMASQAMAIKLNQYLFGAEFGKTGKVTGVLAPVFDFFGGWFADGGTLGAGKWGIAGEAGPELIRGPATVVPLGKAGAGPTIVNNFNYSVDAGISRGEVVQGLQMMREQTKADVLESMRRAGAFA